ncbi:hypothetical protein [Niabella hirudinis]|uniref:hypothetical protein n=1 Tax=Niabella hirudinis TaxID=1285929 RepID=UPI003EBD973B
MKPFFLYLFLLGAVLPVYAGKRIAGSMGIEKSGALLRDTIPLEKQEIIADKKEPPGRQNNSGVKPIKEVPRAKNQAKPKMVVAPKVKMRPVKIIKPKINGKGLGR